MIFPGAIQVAGQRQCPPAAKLQNELITDPISAEGLTELFTLMLP